MGEQRRAIQEQMEDEKTRNARLLRLQQSCAPCTGVWPNCQCEPDAFPVQLRPLAEEQVARAAGTEEANGRQEAPNKEFNGCNGHGTCDETGSCLCEDGFNGNDCNSQNVTEVEDITDASNINEEKKKLLETEQKQKEELVKSKKREETKKQQLNRKEEGSKKQEEALEQNMKSAQKLEEAMKAGDPEAATKYTAKQEEIQKQKLKEEETKKSAEEMKKSSSEELIKQKSIAPKQVTPNEPMAAQMDTSNMTASEQGEIKVAELMQNLTKPGANVPKIAQSIITVSYNT